MQSVIDVVCKKLANSGNENTDERSLNVVAKLYKILSDTNSAYKNTTSDIKIGYAIGSYLNDKVMTMNKRAHLEAFSMHIIQAMTEYCMYEMAANIGKITESDYKVDETDSDYISSSSETETEESTGETSEEE